MKKKPEMQARFMQIKMDLFNKVESRQMKVGDKVPSENQLAETFSVSRMTARRALSELVTEGVLVRSQGIGTFVADNSGVVPVLELPNIDDQINQQQAQYSNEILSFSNVKANPQQSIWLSVTEGAPLYNLKVVHKKDDIAIQLEDVIVNPA
ncbi:GntR family transcriptional regulator, partial [Paraglaciecola sp.]|uniref:GntR family transcriptional regulator n=1 Tax=Paraglaciecola sp. TaxID=1920173 RepID=UPI003EF2A3FE